MLLFGELFQINLINISLTQLLLPLQVIHDAQNSSNLLSIQIKSSTHSLLYNICIENFTRILSQQIKYILRIYTCKNISIKCKSVIISFLCILRM